MKTGLVDEEIESHAPVVNTVLALLRVFSKDAIDVSARVAIVDERTVIQGHHMKEPLMYTARTFFQNHSDEDLAQLVSNEMEEMEEEESEEEEGEEEEGEEEEGIADEPTDADRQLARNVQQIVKTWDKWEPTDPVHILIKKAIDDTPEDTDDVV